MIYILCTLIINVNNAWNDFFNDGSSPNKVVINQQTFFTEFDLNTHIFSSYFSLLSSNDNGGAIYYSTNNGIKALIEDTVFDRCFSFMNGGSVFFKTVQAVFSRICSFNSHIDGESGLFCIAQSTKYKKLPQKMYQSSICNSFPYNAESESTILFEDGICTVSSVNASNNNCGVNSATSFVTKDESGEYTVVIFFSSFTNNTSNDKILIFNEDNSRFLIDSTNIINNEHSSIKEGLIFAEEHIDIKGCCILRNRANYILRLKKGSYLIQNTTIDFDTTYIDGDLYKFETAKTSFINVFLGYKAEICPASYDAVGELTVNIPEKTRKREKCNPRCKIALGQYRNIHAFI